MSFTVHTTGIEELLLYCIHSKLAVPSLFDKQILAIAIAILNK